MAAASAARAPEAQPAIGVIGGGVIGLSSAMRLLESGFKNVTVCADAWTPNTVSDGAGAFWERRQEGHAKWARETMNYYSSLVASGLGPEAGVGFIDGFQWLHDVQDDFPFKNDVPFFRRATPAEVAAAAKQTGERVVDGCFWTSVIADSPTYLMWLMRRIADKGGRFVNRRVNSFEELVPHFDIIINCTGLGARELAKDAAVHVARGQIIRVYAPHIKKFHCVSAGSKAYWHGAYVLPRPTSGVVTLGGTYQSHREFYGIDPEDGRGIWERCVAVCPELKDARVLKIEEWTGMRPARDGDVRLELDPAPVKGTGPAARRQAFVVHNYGHGGCGHSLHWGCAGDTVQLAQRATSQWVASGGKTLPPAARLDGPAPLVIEGMHTVLPRLMARDAGVAVPTHARL